MGRKYKNIYYKMLLISLISLIKGGENVIRIQKFFNKNLLYYLYYSGPSPSGYIVAEFSEVGLILICKVLYLIYPFPIASQSNCSPAYPPRIGRHSCPNFWGKGVFKQLKGMDT